jgi:hypothetical protein
MEYLVFLNHWSLIVGDIFYVPACFLFLYVITGLRSKFDPLFKNVKGWKEQLGIIPWSGAMMRGINYAGCIAYPTLLGKKKKYLFTLYKGYDFRKDCNILHIIISWTWITFTVLGLFFIVIHIALSWLLGVPAFPTN